MLQREKVRSIKHHQSVGVLNAVQVLCFLNLFAFSVPNFLLLLLLLLCCPGEMMSVNDFLQFSAAAAFQQLPEKGH